MSKKVFISYRHQQSEWVRTTLYPVLSAGGAQVVIDYKEFSAGEAVRRQMKTAQNQADLHLLLFTPDYFQSVYCVEEMERAFALDPDFSKRLVLPVILEACHLPAKIKEHEPLYVDLTDHRQQDAEAWSLLMQRCEADLGTSVPNWTTALRNTLGALQRQKSVNLLVKGSPKWREFIAELKRAFPDMGIVDVQSGKTVTRSGFVSEILSALANHTAPVPKGDDLAKLEQVLESQPPTILALKHFDEVARRHNYGHLYASLRHLITDKRQLTLLVQSRAPFGTLLPKNNLLSYLDMETVELGSNG